MSEVRVCVCSPRDRAGLQLRWRDPATGRPRTRSARTSDRREAERRAAALEAELRAGVSPFGGMAWAEFRKVHAAECLAALRPRSARMATLHLDRFGRDCRPARLASVTERMLSQFAAGLRGPGRRQAGCKPITIRGYLRTLTAALNWAHRQRLIGRVPAAPRIKVPKKRPQPVSSDDFRRLAAAAPDERWRAYLLVGWWSGLRLSEARQLRRVASLDHPWVDWVGDRIVLPSTKAGEDQWVPLHPTLRAVLTALPDDGPELFPFVSRKGGPLVERGITGFVGLIARRAGVKLTYHQLRKGFGCRVAQQLGRGNAPVLHRLMRHSTMQITLDYYASTDEILHDAIKLLAG